MAAHSDVLICGAGATGLVLAVELARRGVPFRLVEKLDRPFHGSRGKGIQPRSQDIFEDLGVLDRLTAAGGPYPPSRSHREDGSHVDSDMAERQPASPAEPYRLPLMVPQAVTEAILRERLRELGHRPAFGHELVALGQDEDGVTAHLATTGGNETVHARYLVGTDGGRSFVRHALGIGFPGKTLDMRALVADIDLAGLDRSAWHQFHERSNERRMSLCPLMGTSLFQLQAVVPPEGDVDLSAAALQAMVRERSDLAGLRVDSVSWASVYRMSARLADRYRDGRVFLAGDAAHVHPPTGGQGLNTSVQDAYNLGWKLAAVLAGAPPALLDSYEAERRPIAAAMLSLSTRLLDNARRGDNRRGREVQQLDLGYREGPLAPPAARTRGPAPGDRAPDARLQGAAGQPRRLFDLFAGTHWTLLTRGVARQELPEAANLRVHAIGPAGELHDPHGDFADSYALADGEWILIRPDGYVGAAGSRADIAALQAYLAAVTLVVPGPVR